MIGRYYVHLLSIKAELETSRGGGAALHMQEMAEGGLGFRLAGPGARHAGLLHRVPQKGGPHVEYNDILASYRETQIIGYGQIYQWLPNRPPQPSERTMLYSYTYTHTTEIQVHKHSRLPDYIFCCILSYLRETAD